MIFKTATDQETILQVVRGERPWTDLRAVGMDVTLEGNQCDFHNPNVGSAHRPRKVVYIPLYNFSASSVEVQQSETNDIQVAISACDLAKGLRAYQNDSDKLREWAFVMEAADHDWDVETHPDGELLLNALWSASFGEKLSEPVAKVIERLAIDQSS